MPSIKPVKLYTCARCIHGGTRLQLLRTVQNESRYSSTTRILPNAFEHSEDNVDKNESSSGQDEDRGAMSRRLKEMTEETVSQGGRSARKAVEDAGFSEELKRNLQARLEDSQFRSENAAAFAQMNMPAGAGKGTRDNAVADPWTGGEKLEDAALRMLNDIYKPLRGTGGRIPTSRGSPANVDLRLRKAVLKSKGERLANARDKTSIYAMSQDSTMTEQEREQMRKQLKERFTAGARPMPTSVQGLAALASERIEDAIARGQFRNIPRGKGVNIERDYNASSPFLDTTEYFMNKIIQKQDIVPPWIEKQQELVKAAATFRGRLRNDWKRHAARVIASKGGSLEIQVRRARAYAAAEAANNPKAPKVEVLNELDGHGKIAEVTVTETVALSHEPQDSDIVVTESLPQNSKDIDIDEQPSVQSEATKRSDVQRNSSTDMQVAAPKPLNRVFPFRDPAWESLERAYHTLAIADLNNLTRSYNLMAPDLAKKPYFSLERELRSCFADVAPVLPDEIRTRAAAPTKIRVEIVGHRAGGVLERFAGDKAKVYDSQKPNHGFKEFWRDLWGGEKERGAV